MAADTAGRLFQMFDTNDSLFTGELFTLCKVPDSSNQDSSPTTNTPCMTAADCTAGEVCQVVDSIKCKGGENNGQGCMTNSDCSGGTCFIPPGQERKLRRASPSE